MKRNKKLAILIVFAAATILVWIPKGKNANDVSLNISTASFGQTIALIKATPKKRTEFVGWPRDPFAEPQMKEKEENTVGSVSDLKFDATVWDDRESSAFINGNFVSTGDKIDGKTVKQIEHDRVILTDGTNDYVLELGK